jgi:hypothetical protein
MPLNRKAQIFTWDIILATVIFLIALGTILFLWTDTIEDIDAADTEYELNWLATAVSEQLARTPGTPHNWTRSPNIGNITVLGLADTKRIGNDTKTLDRVLDPDKVIAFINLTQTEKAFDLNKYARLRNRILGTGKYDFYVELSCLDSTVMDCFEGLRFDNIANANITCNASNTTFYISNYTLKSDPALVAVWRFDEGVDSIAADASGGENDATITGANWTAGKYGSGLKFDGSQSDYVTVPDAQVLRLGASQTVETWISVDNNAANLVRLVGKGNLTHRNYGLWRESDGDMLFQIYGTSDNCDFWDNAGPGSDANIAKGTGWHHVAGTYNGSVGNLYIDGNLVSSSTCAVGTPYNGSDSLTIGYSTMAGHSYFNGTIDDVKIFSRALSGVQIAQEYARAEKYCRFAKSVSMANVSYQIYDSKTVTFRKGRSDSLFDDDTAFLEPTANLKVVVYRNA